MLKPFDWVDEDLLFFKLLEYNIDENIYNCIKAMYNHPLPCVKLNSNVADWFPTESGVCQSDSLSPTMFAIFINDLASQKKQLNIGTYIENGNICILLFADDIVIQAEDEIKLQILLDFTNEWCKKWRMKINNDMTKVVHFRKCSTKITDVTFQLGEHEVKKVDKYKYLGVYFNEYFDYQTIANTLSGAAGRTLGSVISKFNSFRNVGFKTYSKLYHSGVVPILDYCSGVW